jgi:transcriptional regulator with XRE-family HTH domain
MRFNIHPELSKNIKARRIALGLSQEDLATCCGVKPAVISHYETDNRSPSITALIRLSSRMRCTVSDLLGQTNAPVPIVCPTCNGTGTCLPNAKDQQTPRPAASDLLGCKK